MSLSWCDRMALEGCLHGGPVIVGALRISYRVDRAWVARGGRMVWVYPLRRFWCLDRLGWADLRGDSVGEFESEEAAVAAAEADAADPKYLPRPANQS